MHIKMCHEKQFPGIKHAEVTIGITTFQVRLQTTISRDLLCGVFLSTELSCHVTLTCSNLQLPRTCIYHSFKDLLHLCLQFDPEVLPKIQTTCVFLLLYYQPTENKLCRMLPRAYGISRNKYDIEKCKLHLKSKYFSRILWPQIFHSI